MTTVVIYNSIFDNFIHSVEFVELNEVSLSHPSAREPMFAIIAFVQVADDDSAAGAGMDEVSVFQIDADVGGATFPISVVEKNEVAFAQISFLFLFAIKCALFVGRAVQGLLVHLTIDLRSEARAVGALSGVSSASIRRTYPMGGFDVKCVIVLPFNINTQADGGFCQLLIIDTR